MAEITIMNGHKNLQTRVQMYDRYRSTDRYPSQFSIEYSMKEVMLTLERAKMLMSATAAIPMPIPP